MGKKYKLIDLGTRKEIHLLLAAGVSQVAIAAQLGVNKSTISRELKRNSEKNFGYLYPLAHSRFLVS